MNATDNDFSLFDLDQHRLDAEWVNQPKAYYEQALLLADARKVLEQAKAERDVVDAELDKDIRLHPTKYKLEKLTEPVIANTVLLQKEHQKAGTLVIGAKHAVDVLQAAVDALDHRKKALENLVHLFLSNYWSEPREPKGEHGDKAKEMERSMAFDKRRRDV